MNKKSQSPSICQRLINFIVGVMDVPVEEGNETGPINRLKGDVGSDEIVVEFRHTNGSGRLIGINKQDGYAINLGSKNEGLISINGNKTNNDNIDRLGKYRNDNKKNNRAVEDINEKSDEYIKSRKKAMNRNYSFD